MTRPSKLHVVQTPPLAVDRTTAAAALGVSESTLNEARAAYRRLASENHPDKGGTAEAMAEVNRAWQEAQEALT